MKEIADLRAREAASKTEIEKLRLEKQYTHTPIQTIVNVGDTHLAPLLNNEGHDKCYP